MITFNFSIKLFPIFLFLTTVQVENALSKPISFTLELDSIEDVCKLRLPLISSKGEPVLCLATLNSDGGLVHDGMTINGVTGETTGDPATASIYLLKSGSFSNIMPIGRNLDYVNLDYQSEKEPYAGNAVGMTSGVTSIFSRWNVPCYCRAAFKTWC